MTPGIHIFFYNEGEYQLEYSIEGDQLVLDDIFLITACAYDLTLEDPDLGLPDDVLESECNDLAASLGIHY